MIDLSLRQKEVFTGLFGIIFFFGGFLAGELGLRTLNTMRFGDARTLADKAPIQSSIREEKQRGEPRGFYSEENTGLRRPYPNQKLGAIRINNHGFRGPDLTKKKQKGTVRIAFLGSSTTYDADAPEGKAWPERTVENLAEALTGCHFDFINAGLPGFGMSQIEQYWNSVVKEFSPDVVITGAGNFTVDTQRAASAAGFRLQNQQSRSWLSKYSELWALIAKNAEVVRLQKSAFSDAGKFQPNIDSQIEKFSNRLNAFIDNILELNLLIAIPTTASHTRRGMTTEKQLVAADSALYYMPFISIPTLIELQEQYNDAVRRVVQQRTEVLLIDGDELIPADNRHFSDSRHFTELGSAAMGKRVAGALLSSPRFRELVLNVGNCTQNIDDT